MPILGRQLVQPRQQGLLPTTTKKDSSKQRGAAGFFSKLFKLCGRQSLRDSRPNVNLAEIRKQHSRKQRSSLSSTLSNIEPMPTIVEEDEEAFMTVSSSS